jgi:hypothetical protein
MKKYIFTFGLLLSCTTFALAQATASPASATQQNQAKAQQLKTAAKAPEPAKYATEAAYLEAKERWVQRNPEVYLEINALEPEQQGGKYQMILVPVPAQ